MCINKNIIKKKEKEEKKEITDVYMKNIITDSKNYRQDERNISNSYKYFNKVCDQLGIWTFYQCTFLQFIIKKYTIYGPGDSE